MALADAPWYPAYAATAPLWGLSALEDQRLAGLLMWCRPAPPTSPPRSPCWPAGRPPTRGPAGWPSRASMGGRRPRAPERARRRRSRWPASPRRSPPAAPRSTASARRPRAAARSPTSSASRSGSRRWSSCWSRHARLRARALPRPRAGRRAPAADARQPPARDRLDRRAGAAAGRALRAGAPDHAHASRPTAGRRAARAGDRPPVVVGVPVPRPRRRHRQRAARAGRRSRSGCELESADVIHSFWVPRFGWKRDTIPGKANVMQVRVRPAGHLRRRVHRVLRRAARLDAVRVVVEPREQFDAWVQQQRAAGAGLARRAGAAASRSSWRSTCVSCHADRRHGRDGAGRPGPDPPRRAGRRSAPACIANTPENLRRWIRDPQAIKPGVLMPRFGDLSDEDLAALVAYLRSLK